MTRARPDHNVVVQRASHAPRGIKVGVNSPELAFGGDGGGGVLVGAGGGDTAGSVRVAGGTLELSAFTASIRPVVVVGGLPVLPSVDFPLGSTCVLTPGGKLYRNVLGVWSTSVDAADLVFDLGGFSGPWMDFIRDGVYNAFFSSAVATATKADGEDSHLPRFTVSRVTLTSLGVVASSSWAGGFYLDAVPSALSGSLLVKSDQVPCSPFLTITPRSLYGLVQVGALTSFTLGYTLRFYAVDRVTLVSTDVGALNTYGGVAGTTGPLVDVGVPVVVPVGARFVTVEAIIVESVGHDAGSHMRIGGIGISQP